MSSFFTLPVDFLTHEHGSIVSFIASTRPFFNSSIVPCIVSDTNEDPFSCTRRGLSTLWENLIGDDEHLKWFLLFMNSDTLQFASRMVIPHCADTETFAEEILKPLVRFQPYFRRTLKHFESKTSRSLTATDFVGLLLEIRSLETLSLCTTADPHLENCVSQLLQFLPLRSLSLNQLIKENELLV